MSKEVSPEKIVRDIRRKTRKKYSAEEKIRIILEGLRGEESIAALCRKEGIPTNLYYRWSKEFLEAGKKRLMGDTAREASSDEVSHLRQENAQLKHLRMLTTVYREVGLVFLLCKRNPQNGLIGSKVFGVSKLSNFDLGLHHSKKLFVGIGRLECSNDNSSRG